MGIMVTAGLALAALTGWVVVQTSKVFNPRGGDACESITSILVPVVNVAGEPSLDDPLTA